MTLEGIVSRKDSNLQNYPNCGDLVLIKQKVILGRGKPFQIFAYVEEMKPTEITPLTPYNRNLCESSLKDYISSSLFTLPFFPYAK